MVFETDLKVPAGEQASWAFVVPGLAYPLWRGLAPPGAIDPWWAWFTVAACFLAVAALHLVQRMPRATLLALVPGLASLVALHFFVLATLNDMSPFYAVGSTMAGLAPLLFVRSRGGMIAYGSFIGALSVTLYLADPDERKLAYWGSLVPVLLLGYRQVSRQVSQREWLQGAVADRTRELSEANRRLRSEIDARARLEEQLRVHHKMEAVGRLAGGVAHDFNNLLTTIGVYAELLEKGLLPSDPLRREVGQIQRANRQAAQLTQQLLTVGRRSQVKVVALDLNEVVPAAASVLSHLLGSEAELVCRYGEGRHPILANSDQIQQILINLVTNGRDAMAGRGVLTIETGRCNAEDLSSADENRKLANDEYVRLSITDTGPGIPADVLERIFDPFFTTKEDGKGAGLGLAIVHGIVTQGGGFVHVESAPGRGARFELYWPRADECPEGVDAAPRSSKRIGKEELLLVEDEADLRGALSRVLRDSGYMVSEAPDGSQALEMVLARDHPFDLVVTDVVMVRMSGFELARRVAEHHPDTKVLLISGHFGQGSLPHSGRDLPLLPKPFSVGELVESVRRVLDQEVTASGVVP
jgi:signal transduction histidine kinase